MKDLRFTLDTLMREGEQEKFARLLGWQDVEQMLYYEEMAEREYLLQVQGMPTPPEINFLSKQDPREVYEDMPDMSGVY